jgi:hypothetical protein
MKPLSEQTKDELLKTVTEILEKINSSKTKLDHLESFYDTTFTGMEGQPSMQSKIQALLEQTQTDNRTVDGLKNNIVTYSNEIFTDAESKLSVKTNMDNYLKQIKDDFATVEGFKTTITAYNNELFKDIEGKISIKNQVAALVGTFETDTKKLAEIKAGLEAYSNETLVGTDSTKAKLDTLLSGYKIQLMS